MVSSMLLAAVAALAALAGLGVKLASLESRVVLFRLYFYVTSKLVYLRDLVQARVTTVV